MSSLTPPRILSRKKRSGLTACSDPDCPPQKLKASGYSIIRKELPWKEAHDYCEENHGHLASFINEKDAKDVVDAIFEISKFDEDYDWGRRTEEFGLDRRYWIGLTDIMEEGKWAWVGKGNRLNYQSMWYPGQPDHINPDGTIQSGRRQHCVSLWNPAYWKVDKTTKLKAEKHTFDDVECNLKIYFICEDDTPLVDKRKVALKAGGGNTPPGPGSGAGSGGSGSGSGGSGSGSGTLTPAQAQILADSAGKYAITSADKMKVAIDEANKAKAVPDPKGTGKVAASEAAKKALEAAKEAEAAAAGATVEAEEARKKAGGTTQAAETQKKLDEAKKSAAAAVKAAEEVKSLII